MASSTSSVGFDETGRGVLSSRHRWLPVSLAAAAVAVALVVVATLHGTSGSNATPIAAATSAPVGAPMTAVDSPARPVVAKQPNVSQPTTTIGPKFPLMAGPAVSGLRKYRIGGLTVTIPEDWRTDDDECGFPLSNTIVAAGSAWPACAFIRPAVSSVFIWTDLAWVPLGRPTEQTASLSPLGSAPWGYPLNGPVTSLTIGHQTATKQSSRATTGDPLFRTLYRFPHGDDAILVSSPDESTVVTICRTITQN